MEKAIQWISNAHPVVRIILIMGVSVLGHFIVQKLRRFTQWLLVGKKGSSNGIAGETLSRQYPRIASLLTIFVSAATFTVYFLAIGLILKEFSISLTAYLASATVIGLAVGFGSQGLVQDIVTGLTLIFSEALYVNDMVEISGQVGIVDTIGLRFTTLINLHGQKIYVPNRTIGIISRVRNGYIRAYVDIQITNKMDTARIVSEIDALAAAMAGQFYSIILAPPENMGIRSTPNDKWQFLRIKMKLWPGQGHLIEGTFKQRVVAAMKKADPEFADWMVTVVYKTE